MGRVGQYVPLSALTADMLRQILLQSELSVYRKYQQFFSGYGIRLELSDTYTDQLVTDALALQTGARGLNHLLEEAMEPLLFRLAAGTLPKTVYLEKGIADHAV